MTLRQLLPVRDDAPDLLELYGDSTGYLRAGFVTSLDGAVAVGGVSAPLSGTADRAVFRALRAVCDVVLVGAGTARAEDYAGVRVAPAAAPWRAARGLSPVPLVAVVSRTLRLDPARRVFAGVVRPLVVTCEAAPADRRAELSEVADVLVAGRDEVDLREARGLLADRGLTRVLCEGGPTLLQACLRSGVLDELCTTLAPLLVGGGAGLLPTALAGTVPLRLVHLLAGDDGSLAARWAIAEPAEPAQPAQPAGPVRPVAAPRP